MSFIGNSFTNQTYVPKVDYFNGDASTTAFTLSRNVASVFDVQVVVENVPQNPASAFTVAGNVITFTSAPPSGTNNIYVRYTTPTTNLVKPAPGTVSATELSGGTVATTADATINGVTVGKGGGTATNSTAVGVQALYNTSSTGTENSAFGRQALYAITSGGSNVGFGNYSLYSNTSGNYNTALGYSALQNNTTAHNNTAVGYQAGYNFNRNDIYGRNVVIGSQAMYTATTSNENVIVGTFAGYSLTTNGANVFVGQESGYVSTGSLNTFVGYGSGNLMTTGTKNTIVGRYSGNQGGLDIRTASNYIVLSDGDGNPKQYNDGSSWYLKAGASLDKTLAWDGAEFYPAPDNVSKLGHPSFRWTTVYATTGTINTSDANQKQQIRSLDEVELAVARRIKGLIKAFKWNDSVAEKGDDARIHVGVIAQEVQAAFEAEGLDAHRYGMFCSDTWYEVNGDKGKPSNPYTAETEGAVEVTQLGVRYDQLLAFVIAAM